MSEVLTCLLYSLPLMLGTTVVCLLVRQKLKEAAGLVWPAVTLVLPALLCDTSTACIANCHSSKLDFKLEIKLMGHFKNKPLSSNF